MAYRIHCSGLSLAIFETEYRTPGDSTRAAVFDKAHEVVQAC